jgi:hypothetical protein
MTMTSLGENGSGLDGKGAREASIYRGKLRRVAHRLQN